MQNMKEIKIKVKEPKYKIGYEIKDIKSKLVFIVTDSYQLYKIYNNDDTEQSGCCMYKVKLKRPDNDRHYKITEDDLEFINTLYNENKVKIGSDIFGLDNYYSTSVRRPSIPESSIRYFDTLYNNCQYEDSNYYLMHYIGKLCDQTKNDLMLYENDIRTKKVENINFSYLYKLKDKIRLLELKDDELSKIIYSKLD